MIPDDALRGHLVSLLSERQAHASWRDILADFPEAHRGTKPDGWPYTAWQLLEHLRIAQWDILEFSRKSDHVSPSFPDGYWPPSAEPPDRAAWDESVRRFGEDLEAMTALVRDPSSDLFTPFPHGSGQTLLREAMLVADHNAYHLGQVVLLRKVLGAWK